MLTAAASPATKFRIDSIDILRGLIMIIMALDHTRDFFHAEGTDPTNLATTTPILFFTRWITHFCAAIFVFLSGVSVNLSSIRRTKKQLSIFLLKRGLWLIAVEFIFITFAITLDPFYHLLIFQVIWVIGVSMILLAILIWLPLPIIAGIGILLFFGHDVITSMKLPLEGLSGFLWKLCFTAFGSFIAVNSSHALIILYAILPWTGVMLVGYVLGQVYRPTFDPVKRKQIVLMLGIMLTLLFVLLRTFNIYGDPAPWKIQHTTALSIVSFFNVSKYPPSLLYLTMTIGPGLLFLAAIEKVKNVFTRVLALYGSVPFSYYVLHFYLLRLLNIVFFFIQGYGISDIVTKNSIMLFRPQEFGFNLLGVYLIWLLVVGILYFPCRWFSKYKKTHQQWWLSYL